MPTIRCPKCDGKVKVNADEVLAFVRCNACGHKIRLDDKDDGAYSSKPSSKKRSSDEGISEWPPKRRGRDDDEDDEDDGDDVRIKKKKKKTNPLLKTGKRLLDSMTLPAKIIVGLAILAALVSCLHPVCYFVPIVYGFILIILGSLLFMVVVFNDSPTEIFLCILIPFYNLYYLVTHWEETKATVYLQLFGILVMFSFICAVPFHAAVFGVWGAVAGKGKAPEPLAVNKGPDNINPPIVNPPDNKPIEKKPAPRITGDAALDQLLDDFQSKDFKTRDAAVKSLNSLKPNEHRAAVVKRLNEYAKAGDVSTRHRVLEIMKTWATRDDTLILLGYLDDPDVQTKNLTLQALGEVRDERAADAMARALLSLQTQWHSEQALRKLGPAAELGLLNVLNDKDLNVRVVALRLLGEVGTVRSVPTLQALTKAGGDFTIQNSAQQALTAIAARANKK